LSCDRIRYNGMNRERVCADNSIKLEKHFKEQVTK
jgi:hypothetical protein